MEIQMMLYLPRDAVSVPVSRQVLDSCLETLGVTPDTRGDIALALSEACANVIQHAGAGEEYEVQVSARNCRCAIEVVNVSSRDRELSPVGVGVSAGAGAGAGGAGDGASAGSGSGHDGHGHGPGETGGLAVAAEPVPPTAEHGRGLQIIDAVMDNLQLTGDEKQGTTVHFEKTLDWLPGAPGQHLFMADGGS